MAEEYKIREQRPYTYADGCGKSKDMECRFRERKMETMDRTFAQGLQCQEINSIGSLLSLEDSVFIIHSPQGCIGCSVTSVDRYRVGQAHRGKKVYRSPRIIVSNLDQNDIIMGGEKKLVQSILAARDRYNPKVIFIFASCASGIIADDIDGIAAKMQKDMEAIIVPIHCEGFKSKICASGFDAAFRAISKYILKDEKNPKEEGLVNLFAPTTVSYKDQLEMERMLSLLGLRANYVPFFSSLEKMRKMTVAQVSTSICKVFADEFMQELKDKYDIPFSHTVMPVGLRNTDSWFLGIAKIVGKEKEALKIIEQEHKRIQPEIDKIKSRLEGKRVFVCGGTGRSFAAALLIEDFGMKLVGLETPVYDGDAQDDIQYLNKIYGDFIVDIANMQPFEQVNIVKRLKPDLFIGVPHWSARLGIPTTHILEGKRPTMGYDGILYLGNKIADQMENPGFNKKLSKYARLPYKESWYKEDPFKYIKKVQS
ncbi:MAG: nitrogen fixation protein NifE [Elusimicrobiota bacterium]|jgi:nitrogenase molybdenum-iron protein alpha chain|nr:nitrogen fixation protein NifE [Elusimicrobiota bacterium]